MNSQFTLPPNKPLYFEQVWSVVRKIPSGKVATYGGISKMLPKPDEISEADYRISASRWVGLAMAACPDDVPWHRVINSKGKISHSQMAKQKRRLVEEGVVLVNDVIDLYEFEWQEASHNSGPVQARLF